MSKIKSIVPVILVMNDEYWLPYSLSSISGYFERYVIYNIGSQDATENIIDWFVEKEKPKGTSFYIRHLPFVDPEIQGIFRNSMIAEAQSNWYFIADGDEVYTKESMDKLFKYEDKINNFSKDKIYGIFNRIEVEKDLKHRYEEERSHHRIYHRTAIWKGTHPGERPVIQQKDRTEEWLNGIYCWHFHNAVRSSLEDKVPLRIKRKSQRTYHPGNIVPFNLLEEVPVLRTQIENFKVNPDLERLQNANN